MRKLWLFCVLLAFICAPVSAETRFVTQTWTAAANGSVTDMIVSEGFLSGYGFYLDIVRTDPGTPSPTDDYDVEILDASGNDILGNAGLNRDDANTETIRPSIGSYPCSGALTIHITNNSVDSATGTVLLVFSDKPVGAAASVTFAEGSAALPTTVIQDSDDAVVKPGDATNKSVRVSIVDGITPDVDEGSPASTPATIAGMAETSEAPAVDDGDVVRKRFTVTGVPLNWGPALPGDTWKYSALIETDSWTAIKAGEANYYMCATVAYVQNSDSSVATVFSIYDDDDGDVGDATLVWSGYAAASGGGGKIGEGNAPVFCSATIGNGLYFVAGTTSSESRVTVRGFRTKVDAEY